MAQELDLADLLCDMGDEHPAVAFASSDVAPSFDRWTALCPPCLNEQRRWHPDHFVYVRISDDPAAPADTSDDARDNDDDDSALKF